MILTIDESLGEYDTPNQVKFSSELKTTIDGTAVPIEELPQDVVEAIMGAFSMRTINGRIEPISGYVSDGHGLIIWKFRINVRINGERVAFEDLSGREKEVIVEDIKHSLYYHRENARGEFHSNGLHIH